MIDMNDFDYTIAGKRIYLSRFLVKKEMRNKGIGTDIPNLLKLEKVLWEKLNIGTSMNVILQQIDKFYEEISK